MREIMTKRRSKNKNEKLKKYNSYGKFFFTFLNSFRKIDFIFYICIFLLLAISCKRNSYEVRIRKAIKANDYFQIATLCSEYKFKEYKTECENSLIKSEDAIQEILSKKQELPFMKIILEQEKSQKIQELLKANIELGIKYRSIWNETAEVYKE